MTGKVDGKGRNGRVFITWFDSLDRESLAAPEALRRERGPAAFGYEHPGNGQYATWGRGHV